MDFNLVGAIGAIAFKLACLAVGSLFCFFGYRLFMAGIVGKAGDLEASAKWGKFALRSAAPGTFFAVLGAGIVVCTIWTGITFTQTTGTNSRPSSLSLRQTPP